jgi:hypothetical protein
LTQLTPASTVSSLSLPYSGDQQDEFQWQNQSLDNGTDSASFQAVNFTDSMAELWSDIASPLTSFCSTSGLNLPDLDKLIVDSGAQAAYTSATSTNAGPGGSHIRSQAESQVHPSTSSLSEQFSPAFWPVPMHRNMVPRESERSNMRLDDYSLVNPTMKLTRSQVDVTAERSVGTSKAYQSLKQSFMLTHSSIICGKAAFLRCICILLRAFRGSGDPSNERYV